MANKYTIFDSPPQFEVLPENQRLQIDQFLHASRQILQLIDALGASFKPIKSDIKGNIDTLQKILDGSEDKNITFNDLLQKEFDEKKTKAKGSGAIASLWLTRALHFLSTFIQYLVEDHESGDNTENMVGNIRRAYEAILKPHHGWVTRKLFGVIIHAVPWRKDFLKTLAGKEARDDEVLALMKEFNVNMSSNVDVLCKLLKELEIDFHE